MRKVLTIGLALVLATFGGGSLLAADCVDVDVEVPAQLVKGQMFTVSAELINCGSEAGLVSLSFSGSYNGNPSPIPPVQVYVWLNAGQVVSRSFTLPVPPIVPTGDYELCVTATSGTASMTDCAAFEVVDAGGAPMGGDPNGFLGEIQQAAKSAFSTDCVEIDIEIPAMLTTGQMFDFSAELINCGAEAALITLSFAATYNGQPVMLPPVEVPVYLNAGQMLSRTVTLPVPPVMPTGNYEICVTATVGDVSASDCAAFSVTGNGGPGGYKQLFVDLQDGLRSSLSDDNCIDLDVEVPAQVIKGQTATISAELVNCGAEAVLISFNFSLVVNGQPVNLPPAQARGRVAAGETISFSLTVPIPPPVPTGTYELCVTATAGTATVTDCAIFEVVENGGRMVISGEVSLPTQYQLLRQNSPNPFNPTTTVTFELPRAGQVTLQVYDITGRVVRTLVDSYQPAGTHSVEWDGSDRSGAASASGIYFYRIHFEGSSEARKMILLK